MTMNDCRFGFRVVGGCHESRQLVDAAAAFRAHADCDKRAELHRECYLSAFQYADDFRLFLDAHDSPKGFSGACWSPWLWFDVDRLDLDQATRDARRLAAFLAERYRIDGDELLLFFSGSKCFHVGQRFSYLVTLMDRYSQRIIGWHLAEDMTEALVLKTIRSAIRTRQSSVNLIHHTDRRGQYAGTEYRDVMQRANISQRMSSPDNAFMESGFGTIKTELEMTEYESHRAAERDLAEYLDYYNTQRKHSAFAYLTPAQFERSCVRPK